MTNKYEEIFSCLASVQQTLSVCSKCLECCDPKERELFGELSEDSARMAKKLKEYISTSKNETKRY